MYRIQGGGKRMKGLIKQLKYRFYRQRITKRIILVITMLSILSNAVFVGSVFVIMKNQLFNKTKLDHEKDITMLEKELEMFFNGIRNDAVSYPELMIYNEDFTRKNMAHCYYVIGLGNLGLGNMEKAREAFEKTLSLDRSHNNCRLLLNGMDR